MRLHISASVMTGRLLSGFVAAPSTAGGIDLMSSSRCAWKSNDLSTLLVSGTACGSEARKVSTVLCLMSESATLPSPGTMRSRSTRSTMATRLCVMRPRACCACLSARNCGAYSATVRAFFFLGLPCFLRMRASACASSAADRVEKVPSE